MTEDKKTYPLSDEEKEAWQQLAKEYARILGKYSELSDEQRKSWIDSSLSENEFGKIKPIAPGAREKLINFYHSILHIYDEMQDYIQSVMIRLITDLSPLLELIIETSKIELPKIRNEDAAIQPPASLTIPPAPLAFLESRILNYLKDHYQETFYPSDIAAVLNIDLKVMYEVVEELRRAGKVDWAKGDKGDKITIR